MACNDVLSTHHLQLPSWLARVVTVTEMSRPMGQCGHAATYFRLKSYFLAHRRKPFIL
jgi:hypothetical protein